MKTRKHPNISLYNKISFNISQLPNAENRDAKPKIIAKVRTIRDYNLFFFKYYPLILKFFSFSNISFGQMKNL